MYLFAAAMVIVLGSVSIVFDNGLIFQMKTSLFYLIMTGAGLFNLYVSKKLWIHNFLPNEINISNKLAKNITLFSCLLWTSMASANALLLSHSVKTHGIN